MDAAEADFDARLYKASADLIPELQTKLPQLIWHDGKAHTRLRTHVLLGKCADLEFNLDRFQDWPQLLDPVLASFVGTIVDGFLTFVVKCPEAYAEVSQSRQSIVSLPHALCRLLYTLCKVRGYKVIVRLLNNEPRYIEPMLSAIRTWQSTKGGGDIPKLAWEVKFIMYLWLSHLMLAPFELSNISTPNEVDALNDLEGLLEGLPEVAKNTLSLGFQSLSSPSKERESAVLLLVRLALRRDMQAVGLPQKLVALSTKKLLEHGGDESTIYDALGHLSLLFSIANMASDSEVSPFLAKVYQIANTLVISQSPHHASIRDAAPARKLLVKIMRACLTHAIRLSRSLNGPGNETINSMLEDTIEYYLEALGDKDSPVRMAASKALSIVALSLNSSMSEEIVEAVLGCLSENVLVENPHNGLLAAKTDMPLAQTTKMRRNVSAVNALKWHGLMLTLGHLLFRRAPPPHQLPDVIEALLLGLEFEQRSSIGTSVGIGVRDGACFGIWALARKYSTQELEAIRGVEIAGVLPEHGDSYGSALQLIAVRLMLSSCLDPSGNIRRGSSAALQELIGRHPDTIAEGIPVVQIVDYQAVARRSRAITEVAVAAAALDVVYHHALLKALLDWRGARAADADSRRWAAAAMQKLCAFSSAAQKVELLQRILFELEALRPRNLGTTAGARHGLLLSLAAIVRSHAEVFSATTDVILSTVQRISVMTLSGSLESRTSSDLEVVMEGLGNFIQATSSLTSQSPRTSEGQSRDWIDGVLPPLNRCILATEKESVIEPCGEAVCASFELMNEHGKTILIESWLDSSKQKTSERLCRGRLMTLASLHPQLSFSRKLQMEVEIFLKKAVTDDHSIEIKTNAMRGLRNLLEAMTSATSDTCKSLSTTLVAGLSDYTNDQRGDIGSLLRLQSLEAVDVYRKLVSSEPWHASLVDRLLPHVVRLAFEKLSKVRHRAWNCLRASWGNQLGGLPISGDFEHLADISSEAYFRQLMPLLHFEALRRQVLVGLSSSIGGGIEDICRACSSALVHYVSGFETVDQTMFLGQLTASFLRLLESLVGREDREVIPVLEATTFLLEQELLSESWLTGSHDGIPGIWATSQKLHVSNVSMERLEALIMVYQALLKIPALRICSLDKLTRQLLHRYPKIRNAAADALCCVSLDEGLVSCDWNAPAGANKPMVLRLRRSLGVVSAAS